MKRHGNLYQQIISIDNLRLADKIACKGKAHQGGVIRHKQNMETNIRHLHTALKEKTFTTAPYITFMVKDRKPREVFRLPYYPDRIAQHAIMNVLEPIFVSVFTADSYSCIKGKGTLSASLALRRALRDVGGTTYCLKLDIRKFYPSVDHAVLKNLLRRKFKDEDLFWLLHDIIDSAPGLPIGNYLSQYFANFYLTYFDHWIKENKGVRYYFRYADDLVILSHSKQQLHEVLGDIRSYLQNNLKLEIKGNYQVFPVAARGIDFVGYVHYHTHVLLRKTIKKSFARMMYRNPNQASAASYYGWAKHCDSRTLIHKLTNVSLQGLKHSKTRTKDVHRRKGENQKNTEQADHGTLLQSGAFESR